MIIYYKLNSLIFHLQIKTFEEKDIKKYNKHFSKFISKGINANSLEGIYKKVHDSIRKNPDFNNKEKKTDLGNKKVKKKKKTYSQRRNHILNKILKLKKINETQ